MTRILIIEDEEIVRHNLIELLLIERYETLSAADGVEGVQLAQRTLPDLILCDILMPRLNGLGVYKALQEDPATAAIPFIFLTARASAEDLRAGMSLGADDYLTKPFTSDELLQAIAARLQKRRALVSQYEHKLEELRQNIALMLPHELRTPLTGILGYASLLMEAADNLGPEEVRQMAEIIHQYGERLHRLIQKFLNYVDLELASRDPARIQALRSHVTADAGASVAHIAQRKAAEAQRHADLQLDDLPEIAAQIDETHLAMLVEELVENAFKFSDAGAAVQVSSSAAAGWLQIVIADRGRGMTAEQIAQVGGYVQFERWRYEQRGQGLGLALAKRVAELHGGKLLIQSGPEQGTRVTATLPIPPPTTDS